MTIDDKIRDEKLQQRSFKISTLSLGNIDKYEHLTGEEVWLSNQRQIIEQAKFIYSPLSKAFEKQVKTIKDQRLKQLEALKAEKCKQDIKSIGRIFLNDMRTNEI